MKNEFEIIGDITIIHIDYLDRKLKTFIDTADLELVSSFTGKWGVVKQQGYKEKFYVIGASKGKQMFMHRLIMNFPEGLDVDHINDDSLNNRRLTNLQAITRSENVKKQDRSNIAYRRVKRGYAPIKEKLERDQQAV